jgi:hypothetical protein
MTRYLDVLLIEGNHRHIERNPVIILWGASVAVLFSTVVSRYGARNLAILPCNVTLYLLIFYRNHLLRWVTTPLTCFFYYNIDYEFNVAFYYNIDYLFEVAFDSIVYYISTPSQ